VGGMIARMKFTLVGGRRGEAGLIVGCRKIDRTQSSPPQRKLGRDLKGIVATQIPGTGTSTIDSG